MTTVLVQTPGAGISARGGQLVIETAAGQHSVPLGHITELVVIGNARISTAVIADLAERGVPIHFQAHAGSLPHSLLGGFEGQVEALRAQVLASSESRLEVARALVTAKVSNCIWVLRRLRSAASLTLPDVSTVNSEDELRGAEGYAARQYFAALQGELPGWSFLGRAYRPAPDPVNAALSFAYMVLLGYARVAVARAGLHPGLGTLHVPHGRRPALALDIMEPFRGPVCDLTVLTLLRSGKLRVEGFEKRHGAVRLGTSGRALLAQELTQRVQAWQVGSAMQRQVVAVQQGWAGLACECWHPPVRA